MICPDCLENGKEFVLKVVDSRQLGPFIRARKYLCPVCGYQNINVEKLEVEKTHLKTFNNIK